MFFGNELKERAEYAAYSDALAAARWVARLTGKVVGVIWEIHLPLLPSNKTSYSLMIRDFHSTNMITVGYLAALMQRHDKPPVLEDFIGKDDKTQRRDMADVPFMSVLPYYDVLPKERPA